MSDQQKFFRYPNHIFTGELPTWFANTYRSMPHGLIYSWDLRFSRRMAINMLAEAWNDRLFLENNPGANQLDQLYTIAYLQYLISHAGLLDYAEIKALQDGVLPPLELPVPPLLSFSEVAAEARRRHDQGQLIGLFHGSFDPFSIFHMHYAVYANEFCDWLIVGFDNDILLQNYKGEIRKRNGEACPRYPLDLRRNIAGSFWPVGTTVEIRPEVVDGELYQRDYADLSADVLFTSAADPALEDKQMRMQSLGGRVITWGENPSLHSTDILAQMRAIYGEDSLRG